MNNLFSLAIILLTCFFNAFGQIPTGKEVCGDYPEVQDDFSNKSAWYHSYYALNAVCDPVQYKHRKVTTEMIYKILLTHCNYVAPTYDTSPVGNCKRVVLNGVITFTTNPEYNFAFLNDPIITRVEPAIRRVTNYTLPAHRLHAGKVIRQIIYKNGKIQIETIGTGNNLVWRYWKINSCQSCMKSFWTSIDSRFIADVQRILAARDSASTIPPPVTESLSDTKELDFIINEAHEPYRYSLIYVTPAKGIALVGRYRPGIKVMLLNHATGKALSCTTTSVKTYPELHGSTIATNLDRTPVVNNEDAALKSMIAIIGNEGTYETINRTLINDIDKINQIDRAIKAGGLFSQALGKYNEGNLADSYAKLFQYYFSYSIIKNGW
ncbi:MAG: hypothetical protein EOP45_15655 [Sphingobacteriaceae bacterium]|nr:MAG: hypothetical protein EOP45_15655 [Sphingobacteriaceae bacterium]